MTSGKSSFAQSLLAATGTSTRASRQFLVDFSQKLVQWERAAGQLPQGISHFLPLPLLLPLLLGRAAGSFRT